MQSVRRLSIILNLLQIKWKLLSAGGSSRLPIFLWIEEWLFPFVKSDRHNYGCCCPAKGGYKIAQRSVWKLVKKGDTSPEKGKGIGKTFNLSHMALFSLSAREASLKIYNSFSPPPRACLWAVRGARHSESTMLNLHINKETSRAIPRLKNSSFGSQADCISISNLPKIFNHYTVRDTRTTKHFIFDHVVLLSKPVSFKLNLSRVFWPITF